MKKIQKAQAGAYKSRTVERNPDNTYKFVTKQKNTPSSERSVTKEVRTLKGAIKGVPKPKMRKPEVPPVKSLDIDKMRAKNGKQMIKRADGSYSQRGLWDNLRSKAAKNKATGAKPKAPSKAMLAQEKKIKAKGK